MLLHALRRKVKHSRWNSTFIALKEDSGLGEINLLYHGGRGVRCEDGESFSRSQSQFEYRRLSMWPIKATYQNYSNFYDAQLSWLKTKVKSANKDQYLLPNDSRSQDLTQWTEENTRHVLRLCNTRRPKQRKNGITSLWRTHIWSFIDNNVMFIKTF